MSSNTAPYAMNMEYPKSPVATAKQASPLTSAGQKKQNTLQSDKKQAAKVKS